MVTNLHVQLLLCQAHDSQRWHRQAPITSTGQQSPGPRQAEKQPFRRLAVWVLGGHKEHTAPARSRNPTLLTAFLHSTSPPGPTKNWPHPRPLCSFQEFRGTIASRGSILSPARSPPQGLSAHRPSVDGRHGSIGRTARVPQGGSEECSIGLLLLPGHILNLEP